MCPGGHIPGDKPAGQRPKNAAFSYYKSNLAVDRSEPLILCELCPTDRHMTLPHPDNHSHITPYHLNQRTLGTP